MKRIISLLIFCLAIPLNLFAQWTHLGDGDDILGEAIGDRFGTSVSMSGDGRIIAIGGPRNDAGGYYAGHIRIFECIDSTWVQMGTDLIGDTIHVRLGSTVSLSDNGLTLGVGIHRENRAEVYDFDGTDWVLRGVPIYGENSSDQFGESVCLSADGNRIAVGARYNDNDSLTNNGHVRFFDYVEADSSWIQVGQDIDGEFAYDFFGYKVHISDDGNTAAIISNDNTFSTYAKVYKYIDTIWVQQGPKVNIAATYAAGSLNVCISPDGDKLAIGYLGSNSRVEIYDFDGTDWNIIGTPIYGTAAPYSSSFISSPSMMGTAISFTADGNTIAVGDNRIGLDLSNSNNNGILRGVARVYTFNVSNWEQVGQTIVGESTGTRLGQSICISNGGDTLAIGGYENSEAGPMAGHVQVFHYNGTTWEQIDEDINGDGDPYHAGSAVALDKSGTFIGIGAPDNLGSGIESGHTRVYQYFNNEWYKLGSDINGEASGDHSGGAIDISDDGLIVCIGAENNDGNGVDAGHARVFKYQSTSNGWDWVQLGSDIDGTLPNDLMGSDVAINAQGNIVAVGAKGGSDNTGYIEVYQYDSVNLSWGKIGQTILGDSIHDEFGAAVDLNSSGNIMAIGAPFNSNNGLNSGVIKVYQYDSSNWIQKGDDLYGSFSEDWFGEAVSLSGDGLTVAVGAQGNDEVGVDAGKVTIYQYEDSNWVQKGNSIYGQSDNDLFGASVSLNNNGLVIVIGSPENNDEENHAGQSRVYQYLDSVWVQVLDSLNGDMAYANGGYAVDINYNGDIVALGAPGSYGGTGEVDVYKGYNLISDFNITITDSNRCDRIFKIEDISGNLYSEVEWHFGDGNTSTLEAPVHQYASEGFYMIRLKAETNFGTDSSTYYFLIEDVEAEIDIVTLLSVGSPIGFENTTYNIVDYFWDFGDGSTSTLPTPEHTFNDFLAYTVTLEVTDSYGCTTSTDTIVDLTQFIGLTEDNAEGITLYPNPTNGVVYIESSNNSDLESMVILNALGEELGVIPLNGKNKAAINLSPYLNGVYLLKVQFLNGEHRTLKLLLNK